MRLLERRIRDGSRDPRQLPDVSASIDVDSVQG